MTLPAWIRPLLAAILAPLTLWLCGQLAVRTGIVVPPEKQKAAVDFLLDYVLPALAANGVARMLWSKLTNPSNSATTQLAEAGHVLNAQLVETAKRGGDVVAERGPTGEPPRSLPPVDATTPRGEK